MEFFFTTEDWARFKLVYLNELYLFSTKGIVQKGNSSRAYSYVYKIANESAKKSNYRMTLRLNKEESHLSNIAKSDVDNGIDEFDNFIRYALSPQNVQKGEDGDTGTEEERDTGIEVILSLLKQLNNLNNSPVRSDTVLAALGRSETIVLNIIEKYFGLDPQELLTDAEKKDKHVRDAGKYGVIVCLFNKILRLYYLYEYWLNPLSVLKNCRNTTHPTPGVLYSTYKISSGEQSNELAKFIVFTFIWIIILCRKTIVSLIYSQTAFLPAVINKNDEETEEAFKERSQSEEVQNKRRIESLKKVLLNEALEYKSFKPGMNLHVKVINAEPQSIEWTLKDDIVKRKITEKKTFKAADGKDVTIPGVFRYDKITIKVTTLNQGSKKFDCPIPQVYTVAKEGTIILDYAYNIQNIIIHGAEGDQGVEEETARQQEPDNTVAFDIITDLDCCITIPGVVQDYTVERNKHLELRIPQGRYGIRLTAKDNPSYTMTRDVNITRDIVIRDMLFAKEVKNHSEWWDEKDIVVLKETASDRLHAYVLWDKSVNLSVYKAFYPVDKYEDFLRDGFFASAVPSLKGNFFHISTSEYDYMYYIGGDEKHLCYSFIKAFTIKNKWYAFVLKYDSCLIIDEAGTEVFQLPQFTKSTYENFASHFEFSEGYAAMLQSDGSICFVSESWKRRSNAYLWSNGNDGAYPVFRNGFCAVEKADEGYLFLEINDGDICERSERYDSLIPVQIDGRWVYKAAKNGCSGIIDPAEDVETLLPLICEDVKVVVADIPQELSVSYDSREDLGNGFVVIGKREYDGALTRYLCFNGKIIGRDFVGYESLRACGVKVKYADNETCLIDAAGNAHMKGMWEDYKIIKISEMVVLMVLMSGKWEIWGYGDGSWRRIGEHKGRVSTAGALGNFLLIEPGYGIVAIMNIDGEKVVKDVGNWVWEKDRDKMVPVKSTIECCDFLYKSRYASLVSFAKASAPEYVGLMKRDTFEEVVAPVYQKIENVGELWVAENNLGIALFTNYGEQLQIAHRLDSVQKYTSGLYMIGVGGAYRLMDKHGNIKTKSYVEIKSVRNGYAAVKEYDDWGFIRVSYDEVEVVCQPEYYSVKDFSEEGYAMVQEKQDGDWGLIDVDGNLVVDCRYDHIEPFRCDYTSARKYVNWYIVRKNAAK